MKHLSIGPRAGTVWCGARLSFYGKDSSVTQASKADCRPCVEEYIRKAWAPASASPVCRPADGDHCETPVAREGDQCIGHANASAQYACS